MKIGLLSSDAIERTGWGRYTRNICAALSKKGIPFELHLPQSLRNKNIRFDCHHNNIKFDLPPYHASIGMKMWRLLQLKLKRINLEADIIHSLVEFPYGITALHLSTNQGIPYGITLHGSYTIRPFSIFPERLYFKEALEKADFLIGVSNYTAKRLLELAHPTTFVTVIPNGVEDAFFSDKNLSSSVVQANIHGKKPFILSVGALKPRKGFDVLIKAFSRVVKVFPSLSLIIVGSGSKKPYLKLIQELYLKNKVFIMDPMEDNHLVALYHACELFVLLPRIDASVKFEGFGLVYLEAAAAGKPSIGTYSAGVPEAILEGETGILVPPENEEAAADAIISLISDKQLLIKYGRQARLWAAQHNWNEIITSYGEVYKKVLRPALL